MNPPECDIRRAFLVVVLQSGKVVRIGNLSVPVGQAAAEMQGAFRRSLATRSTGTLLEIGSRSRSGVTRRDMTPAGWTYVGLDVMAGPNVDIVGDAHELSSIFAANSFDAVMSFSVLEHLLMPWRFVVELNRILKVGAIGLFTTHQTWPVHDAPWDFWRFSDKAWAGLLNPATGYKIHSANMGEPAFVVAQRCHAITNFGTEQHGYLSSNVIFEKTAETKLDWPVSLQDVLTSAYPPGEISLS